MDVMSVMLSTSSWKIKTRKHDVMFTAHDQYYIVFAHGVNDYLEEGV